MICPIVRGEILFGIGRLGQGRRREVLLNKAAELFQALPCEVIPELAGDFYRSIKLTQRRLGLPLDENDLWISATAAAIGATVVSLDKDFQRLEGVAVIAP